MFGIQFGPGIWNQSCIHEMEMGKCKHVHSWNKVSRSKPRTNIEEAIIFKNMWTHNISHVVRECVCVCIWNVGSRSSCGGWVVVLFYQDKTWKTFSLDHGQFYSCCFSDHWLRCGPVVPTLTGSREPQSCWLASFVQRFHFVIAWWKWEFVGSNAASDRRGSHRSKL